MSTIWEKMVQACSNIVGWPDKFPANYDWMALLPRADGSVLVFGDSGTGKTSWIMGWLPLVTSNKFIVSQDPKWRTSGLPEISSDHINEMPRLSNGIALLKGHQLTPEYVYLLVSSAVRLGAQVVVLDDVPVPPNVIQEFPAVRFVIATPFMWSTLPEKTQVPWVCLFKSAYALNTPWVSTLFKNAALPTRDGQFLLRSTLGSRFDGRLAHKKK